jgi:hypothetical protein
MTQERGIAGRLFKNLSMASSSAASITRETFDGHDARLQAAAVKALKAAAGALPTDIQFHRTLDNDYAAALDATAARVLKLTNGLLGLAESSRAGKGKGKLRDKDDVLDRFHAVVVDAMDGMLEQTVRLASIMTVNQGVLNVYICRMLLSTNSWERTRLLP